MRTSGLVRRRLPVPGGNSTVPAPRFAAFAVTRAARIATSSSGNPGANETTASSMRWTTSSGRTALELLDQRREPLLAEQHSGMPALGDAIRPECEEVADPEVRRVVVELRPLVDAEERAADAGLLDAPPPSRRTNGGAWPAQATVSE